MPRKHSSSFSGVRSPRLFRGKKKSEFQKILECPLMTQDEDAHVTTLVNEHLVKLSSWQRFEDNDVTNNDDPFFNEGRRKSSSPCIVAEQKENLHAPVQVLVNDEMFFDFDEKKTILSSSSFDDDCFSTSSAKSDESVFTEHHEEVEGFSMF